MFRYLVGDLQDLDEHVCNNKAIKEAIKRIKPSDGNHDGACPISSRHHHTRRRRRLHLSQARAGAGVVLAFGVVLVSAVVVSGSASSPPPPPPPSLLSNNNNGRQQHGQQPQQDRWTGWTPPPPNPPPDHVARDGNGQGGGGGDDPSRTAAGATAGAAAEGLREGGRDGWGAGPAAGGQGAAAALEDESRVAGRSAGGGNYDVNGLNQGMMGGTAGRGEGQEHSHQLMHERMMMARQQQGQQGQQGQQPQQYHVQQQQHHPQQQQQPTPPPAWVSGASSRHDHQQGSPQRPQLEQFFDANDGGENIAHRTPPGGPPYPPSGMYRQGQVRVGMMGGAGDGVGSDGAASATAAGGGRWDPPPGASAGAITPEVRYWDEVWSGPFISRVTDPTFWSSANVLSRGTRSNFQSNARVLIQRVSPIGSGLLTLRRFLSEAVASGALSLSVWNRAYHLTGFAALFLMLTDPNTWLSLRVTSVYNSQTNL